jgi:hypothetical protein
LPAFCRVEAIAAHGKAGGVERIQFYTLPLQPGKICRNSAWTHRIGVEPRPKRACAPSRLESEAHWGSFLPSNLLLPGTVLSRRARSNHAGLRKVLFNRPLLQQHSKTDLLVFAARYAPASPGIPARTMAISALHSGKSDSIARSAIQEGWNNRRPLTSPPQRYASSLCTVRRSQNSSQWSTKAVACKT